MASHYFHETHWKAKNKIDVWTMATLEEKDKLCNMLFVQIYTEDAEVAIEPKPILWQLLKVGMEIGEDRERLPSYFASIY